MLYTLLKINESAATRTVELRNTATQTVDICFDDSALVSNNNFEFMKVDNSYDCKIKLFGKKVAEETEGSVKCKILEKDIFVGKKSFTKVLVKDDLYYIPRAKIGENPPDNFYFLYTRKDLIQVDTVLHGDLL